MRFDVCRKGISFCHLSWGEDTNSCKRWVVSASGETLTRTAVSSFGEGPCVAGPPSWSYDGNNTRKLRRLSFALSQGGRTCSGGLRKQSCRIREALGRNLSADPKKFLHFAKKCVKILNIEVKCRKYTFFVFRLRPERCMRLGKSGLFV